MTEPVKRFNVFPYLDDGVAELDITHDEDGGYVFADDHDRVVQELRAENADQRLQTEAARSVCTESQGAILGLIAERDTLRAEMERLRALLAEAAQDIADWGAYASDYFREKHDLDACIEKYQAALSGGEEG